MTDGGGCRLDLIYGPTCALRRAIYSYSYIKPFQPRTLFNLKRKLTTLSAAPHQYERRAPFKKLLARGALALSLNSKQRRTNGMCNLLQLPRLHHCSNCCGVHAVSNSSSRAKLSNSASTWGPYSLESYKVWNTSDKSWLEKSTVFNFLWRYCRGFQYASFIIKGHFWAYSKVSTIPEDVFRWVLSSEVAA